ncbi:MAG: S-layer homology domain-containing protein [Candidatus Absconditicoccaceae bacterium]
MDDTFDTNKKWLSMPITSVVVITLMAGFFFSAPQTYALGTNEDLPVTLDQDYQQTSKLSDFVEKVFNFFSEQSSSQINVQEKLSNLNIVTDKTTCEKPSLPFIDIQDSVYKDYITTLYSKGIVIGSTNKFMPNDNLRFYGMIKIIVDSYRSKIGYDIKTQIGLSQRNYFIDAGSDIDKISLKYLNTAYELGILSGITDFDVSSNLYFQENTSYKTVKQILININKQFPLLVDGLTINNILNSEDIITRGKYTEYIVNFFAFKLSDIQTLCSEDWKNNFSDVMNHDYKEDIQLLADLGIISSHAYKFYPDNYLRNYEFIIMLTKTILKKENQDLNIYVLDHTSNISDLDPQASYTKYFEYAYHNGFLDYGFNPQTGEPSVHPNKFITIKEINRILSKLVNKEVNFQAKSNDDLVTRGEFADMLVDGFDLHNGSDKDITNTTENNKSDTTSLLLQQISGRLKSSKLLSKL